MDEVGQCVAVQDDKESPQRFVHHVLQNTNRRDQAGARVRAVAFDHIHTVFHGAHHIAHPDRFRQAPQTDAADLAMVGSSSFCWLLMGYLFGGGIVLRKDDIFPDEALPFR